MLGKWIDEQKTDFIKKLETLVNLNTFTSNQQGVDDAMALFCGWATELGFRIQDINGRHRLISAGNGRGKRVLMIAHMDTVFPPDGEFLQYEPLDNGFVRGPGIGDIKGGLMMGLWTLLALQHFHTDFDAHLIVSAEEEIGSPTLRDWYQANPIQADYAIGLEPAFPLEEKLIVGEPTGVVMQRKGCGHVRFAIQGKASHAGGAWEYGLNAIEAIAQRVIKIQNLSDLAQGITTNVGTIHGGTATNTIADHAEATVDFRYLRQVDGEQTLANIRAIVNDTCVDNPILEQQESVAAFDVLVFMPPMEHTPDNQKMVDVVLEQAQNLGQPVHAISRGGGSDANWTSAGGVPSICGMGAPAEGIHTETEKTHLPTLFDRLALLIRTVEILGEAK